MRGTRSKDESGFTLVELLIVLVILPIIMGAIAAALIATEDNSGVAKKTLGDSQNAQLTAAYYTQDVQGAQYLTTDAKATSPAVCGTGTKLLLALYRPSGQGNTLDIAYWYTSTTTPAEIVRYSCSAGGTSPTSTVVVSDDVTSTSTSINPAIVSPSTFATAADSGWSPTSASTPISSDSNFPSSTINVASTAGFTPSNGSYPITVLTSVGFQKTTCTGLTATSFTGCGSGGCTQSKITGGTQVTQPSSIGFVDISVSQPGSSYTYTLSATPRTWSSVNNGITTGVGPVSVPALFTLGTGVSVQGGANASLTVNGVIDVNSGSLTCTGNPNITASGYEAASGSNAFGNCVSGGTTTTAPAIPDPLAAYLPNYPSTAFPQETVNPAPAGSGVCNPGEYTAALTCTSLEPGVYVLDAGLNLGNGTLSMASNAPSGQGVLIYLPCNTTPCTESLSIGGKGTLSLTSLSSAQSQQYFGTTALAGLVVWQDARDSAAATFGGTSGASSIGTLYLPSAAVTFQGNASATVSRVIASNVSIAGSGAVSITGP